MRDRLSRRSNSPETRHFLFLCNSTKSHLWSKKPKPIYNEHCTDRHKTLDSEDCLSSVYVRSNSNALTNHFSAIIIVWWTRSMNFRFWNTLVIWPLEGLQPDCGLVWLKYWNTVCLLFKTSLSEIDITWFFMFFVQDSAVIVTRSGDITGCIYQTSQITNEHD